MVSNSLYIILNKILDILLIKWVRVEEAELIKTLIAEHHELFLRLFNIHLRPKYHHMIHYPMVLKESGPFPLFWSMRFESKHKELKNTAHSIHFIFKTSIKISISFFIKQM